MKNIPQLPSKTALVRTLQSAKTLYRQNKKLSASAALVLLATLAVIPVHAVRVDQNNQAAIAAYKQQLKDQVDTANGAPRNGRDPSAQGQTNLADAASQPNGPGLRTDTPAANVHSNDNHHVTSNDVYGDPAKTGINAAGCFYDYGIPGQQCMPAYMAKPDGSLDCAGVRMHFPGGLKITGTDRFHLDKNHDGIACNKSD